MKISAILSKTSPVAAFLRWPARAAALLLLCAAAPPDGMLHYGLDARGSDVRARVAFLGFATKSVHFPDVAGQFAVSPVDVAHADVIVDIDTRTLTTGDGTTSLLRGPLFFDAAHYPRLRFAGHGLNMTGPLSATVNGEMTARNVTRKITLALSFSQPPMNSGGTAPITLTGRVVVDRYDFGMHAFPLLVGRMVTVMIRARMVPQ